MSGSRLPRLFLWLFLGFLVVTALLAIGLVLLGDMNETQARILGTSGTISAASIGAMVCAAFRGQARQRWLGDAGIGLCVAAAAAAVVAIWSETQNETYGRFLGCLSTVAGLTALAELLWLLPLAQGLRWLQRATSATIAVLALLTCVQIAGDLRSDALIRASIAIGIVVALQILAHPILWKLGHRGREAPARRLVLTHQHDDVWADGDGRRYSVQPQPMQQG